MPLSLVGPAPANGRESSARAPSGEAEEPSAARLFGDGGGKWEPSEGEGLPVPRDRPRPSGLVGALQILVIEDNLDDIVLIEAALEGTHESRCEVVRNGDEAVAYLRRDGAYSKAPRPDVILLDLNLPGQNGFDVLREIKADPMLRHVPVIFLTTSNQASDVLAAYTYGASGFLSKPAGFEEFRVLIRGFVTYWTQVSRIPRRTPS